MSKKGYFLLLALGSMLLAGCISNIWTGANLIYDRHNIYKKISDYQLAANASRALYKDKVFKCQDCSIDIAVFNGDMLLAGSVPSNALRQEAFDRIKTLQGTRRLFNQLAVDRIPDKTLADDWITTKIRSEILADSDIDPHSFKVVTADGIVYLMGDVVPSEARRVIHIARTCDGVKRVVKLFKYYNLSDHPA